jgi:TetR/AcrR family transcriptional regulator
MARRTPPAARRQRDPERTKARILEAAMAEFAAKGYAGARVSDIADRAGANKQLISYYFGGKEGLYRTLNSQWFETEQQNEPVRQDAGLPEVVAGYLARTPDVRDNAKLLAWEGLAGGEDPGEPVRTARMRDAVADLERRQQAGELAADLDPRCFLLAWMAATIAPVTMPHLVRSIFGADTDPDSDEFLAAYAEQIGAMVGYLAER